MCIRRARARVWGAWLYDNVCMTTDFFLPVFRKKIETANISHRYYNIHTDIVTPEKTTWSLLFGHDTALCVSRFVCKQVKFYRVYTITTTMMLIIIIIIMRIVWRRVYYNNNNIYTCEYCTRVRRGATEIVRTVILEIVPF